ncbi:MAG: ribonuclease R [Bacilli bacterium]
MKEQVLTILKEANKALSLAEIDNLLNLKTKEEFCELQDIMKELEDDTIVYHTNKDKYILFERSHLRKGILNINKKGFGFVDTTNGEEIYIDYPNLNGALHNDLVIVEVITNKNIERQEGRILKVLKRELQIMVGEYCSNKRENYLKLDDNRMKLFITIDKKDSMGAVNGHKVLVKILKSLGHNKYKGQVIRILGHKNDPGVDILSIVHRYNINDIFSPIVLAETEKIPEIVTATEIKERKDLRNEAIFTIDGEDAKDLDDAISLKKLANDHYLLGVHIADVSYYVKENTAIDLEAYDRGTSVYLVDRVIPMLPHKLSNGICSLNEGVDRLTITCEMEIDNNGKIIKYDIYESVINSKKRMTYEAVNQILEQNKTVVGYEPFIFTLKEMQKLAKLLRKHKQNRGFIEFNSDEVKIIVDDNGKPIDITKRYHGTGENMIEDFMIAANESVANYIYYMELPFVYRIHEYPQEEKIKAFISFVHTLGYDIKGKLTDIHPKTMQNILSYLQDKKEFPILSDLLLRSMRKAIYLPENKGHYGLASRCYTHFTSPIRRYPDTTVHRLLRTYLFENKQDHETIRYWQTKLIPLCEHASLKEQSAIDCEREVNDMKIAEYMQEHIGEEFEGIISSVLNFGMFVRLENMVEGLIHIKDMKDDYYIYNEATLSLIGERTKKRYRIGDNIRVRVKAASKEEHTIDFEIISR